ncbi:hypothetical protein IQ269_05120 [Tychonema sp. LEGE 07199]|uniref:hypothetical protein n=1 Tax=unclassified Tychonema TaxID=2642144 RepID=UPI0018809961|nr:MULTISPECIES: hypothetical protein [unclassified Tychonema]MBE9120205.1 hypothetical protein [Tychonema sp. LEGE 07199]MBE9133027.1 hypothetical protein [Tychonema sp. LEGE 07196]
MCDRIAIIYFAPLDVLLIAKEEGRRKKEEVIGNCVKSGYTVIAKQEKYLAAAGIALLHRILLAMTREI